MPSSALMRLTWEAGAKECDEDNEEDEDEEVEVGLIGVDFLRRGVALCVDVTDVDVDVDGVVEGDGVEEDPERFSKSDRGDAVDDVIVITDGDVDGVCVVDDVDDVVNGGGMDAPPNETRR